MSDLLRLDQLANMLGVTLRTIQHRRQTNTLGIPVQDITTSSRPMPRVRRDDVEAYLRTRRVS